MDADSDQDGLPELPTTDPQHVPPDQGDIGVVSGEAVEGEGGSGVQALASPG